MSSSVTAHNTRKLSSLYYSLPARVWLQRWNTQKYDQHVIKCGGGPVLRGEKIFEGIVSGGEEISLGYFLPRREFPGSSGPVTPAKSWQWLVYEKINATAQKQAYRMGTTTIAPCMVVPASSAVSNYSSLKCGDIITNGLIKIIIHTKKSFV